VVCDTAWHGQGRLHKIGEDVSEVLDVIPAMLRVLRTIRPKYGCRGCTEQAKALPRLIESGLTSTALVTHVVVSKFAWYFRGLFGRFAGGRLCRL
jgi:transposase